jgi:hypothetical protein
VSIWEKEESGEAIARFAAGPKGCLGLWAEGGRDRPVHNPLFSSSARVYRAPFSK